MDSQIEFLRNTRKEARKQIIRQSVKGGTGAQNYEEVRPQEVVDSLSSDRKQFEENDVGTNVHLPESIHDNLIQNSEIQKMKEFNPSPEHDSEIDMVQPISFEVTHSVIDPKENIVPKDKQHLQSLYEQLWA